MNNNTLNTQPIPKLIRTLAIPASIGFFFNTMFNVVDTYFAGMISTQALAALSLSFPVFFIIIALGSGLSTGATAVIANALGAGRDREVQVLSLQTIILGIVLSAGLTVAGLIASPPLFTLLGASEKYLHMCLSYMNTIFAGTVGFIFAYTFNAILNATGDTRSFRNFLILGFFGNIILDPWFIFGGFGIPAMGIVGVAFSTVLIELLGSVYLGLRVHHTGMLSGCTLRDCLPQLHALKEIIRQGFPAALNLMTVGIGIFVITYFISAFGKEAVAAYGIAVRIEQIVLLPTIGLNVATLTLVSYSNGARLFDRIEETLRTALRYGGACMGVGGLTVFILAAACMRIFTHDTTVIAIGSTYLRIDALALYAYVILFVHVSALQGIKRPAFAVFIGLFRQIIAPAMVFAVLTHVLGFGLLGIWWGICSITWCAALMTFGYSRRLLKRVPHLS